MFSKNEILTQLRSGANASDIAQKMADEINAAVEEFEAEKEQAKRSAAYRTDARNMVETMAKFFTTHMGEEELTSKEIDEATDAVMELIDSFKELKSAFDEVSEKEKKPARIPSEDLDDETIRRFIKSL